MRPCRAWDAFCFVEVEGLDPWTILKVVAGREDSEVKSPATDFVLLIT